jgi:tRNAThr (cytosine32-N3)-methyltransferase
VNETAARTALDRAHEADPEREGDGRAAELAYVERIERWLARLAPDASPALRLAARAQHLERWAIPRSSYPLDRIGYHRWRQAVHERQGERARELLLGAGCAADLAERVGILVAKRAGARDPEGQTLEDAACLEFLERELAGFAADHPDYTREKFVAILRRTAAKMSQPARAIALALPLPETHAALLREAVS